MSTQNRALADRDEIIADLRRELAERTAERDEALAQQTATTEVLGVINTSPDDLTPVFDAMLERAVRLCDAEFGLLQLYDSGSGGFRFVAGRYLPSTVVDYLQQRESSGDPIRPLPGGIFGPLISGETSVHIPDISTWERYRSGSAPMHRVFHELGGARTWLTVALRKGAALAGILSIYRCEVRPFSDRHIALLRNFATQAEIAMENARLLAETQQALERQTATSDILRTIAAGNADGTLRKIAETTLHLFGAVGASFRIAEGNEFRLSVSVGAGAEQVGAALWDDVTKRPTVGGRNLPGTVVRENRQIHLADLDHLDPDIADWPGPPVARSAGIRTMIGTPLRTKTGAIGALTVYRDVLRPFEPVEQDLLQSFADQAVIAIDNARLITETREALDQQTATAEVLSVINASPADLAPVFHTILEKAHHLCESAHGHLTIYDGDLFRIVAMHGIGVGSPFLTYPFRPEPSSLQERLLNGERLIHITDIAIDATSPQNVRRQMAIKAGFHTVIFVPLRKDGVLVGYITAYRREVRPFSEKQIALLQNFAAQAVIAMENARLITETREALEQQTATAEVLGVINSSPGDLTPVFDAMLEKATRLCDAAFGTLATFDGMTLRTAATRGVPKEYAKFRMNNPPIYGPKTAPGRLIAGERLIHNIDLKAEDAYLEGEPNRRALVDIGGARSAVQVALRRDDALLGSMTIYRQEVHPFTEKQIALLQNFAAQAVIAMENARLITETREALEQQTATAEVLGVINSSPGDLAPVFDTMLKKAAHLCEATYGLLGTYDADSGFRGVAAVGFPIEAADALSRIGHPPARTALGRLERTRQTIQLHDILSEPDYAEVFRRNPWLKGVHTNLVVPMLKEGALVGVFNVFRQEVRPFSDKQIALLENFAAQAVIAMENARLITETREALDQQTATAEVLQVINGSSGDLTPVFNAMLEKAHSLCGITQGSLELYDGERFRAVACRGLTDAFAGMLRQGYPASDNPATRPLIDGERFAYIPDVSATGYAVTRTSADTDAIRTLLCVPLRRDGVLLGMIASARREVRPFSDKEIALLENFAAQAVIAMENARLLTETREALEQQTATAEVLGVINSSPGDLAPVFDAMLEKAMRLCEAAFGTLYTYSGELMCATVIRGAPSEYAEYLKALGPYRPPGSGSLGRLVAGELIVHSPDAAREEAYREGIQTPRRALVDLGGGRTHLAIPLRARERLLGAFAIYRQEVRPFTDKQIALVQNFAAQAVIAIENARLLTETREARDKAETALHDLQAAQASLVQAQKMAALGQLTAGIAHEIKNPLNFVNNFASLSTELLGELKEEVSPAVATMNTGKREAINETIEMLTSNLDKIVEHGHRADNIVKSMLEHSRGVSGERREVDLNALVDEALNLAYHGARAQDAGFNVTLERDYAAVIPPIELAPQEIMRVFLNLFGNAFYATRQRLQANGDAAYQPTLSVMTREVWGGIEVRVRDNGAGISSGIREKLFQPFFTTKPTGEGTGLGLSISYEIVTQQHGGSIEVESEEGAFTEFTIRLPRQ